ncbi:hypothetical protein BJX99DRAFT_270598 [Aspergillus californicus]
MPPQQSQTLSVESARQLVEGIAEEHGYLGEDVYSTMPPKARQKVENAMKKKDLMIGSSVMTLAKNLYNSSARFVFELLQNAEDNAYSNARGRSEAPFVSFHIHPRRIVLECNEDGFTPDNLTAICDVGKSSKTGAQGYIGEKGIGFKSVFMVAWKARIQSNAFSFSFLHKPGDSGMGMVTPVCEDLQDSTPYPGTRITLFLHEHGSPETLTKQRETTLQQFRELQATVLLFMKNLRKIEVKEYDENEQETSSTLFSKENLLYRATLRKVVISGGETKEEIKHYHVTKRKVSNLAKSENRTYTDAEIESRAFSQGEVILAFPLMLDSTPVVEPQDVFAFLPIRNMGFPFLIQADFVTDASRQDVVKTSARNMTLLQAVSQTFVLAVSEFCKHRTLRYQWMRYLPTHTGISSDGFWQEVLKGIDYHLARTAALWTRSHKRLRYIRNVRQLPPNMLDNNGDPLLPDLAAEQYLAREYLPGDLKLLSKHGLCHMSQKDFVDRVRIDLDRGESSIMRSPNTGDEWHSRVAKVLVAAYSSFPEILKGLALVPLRDSSWGSRMFGNKIRFSHINGLLIPSNPFLQLVDPAAEGNNDRKLLFETLGVQKPEVTDIRRTLITSRPDATISRTDLAFLYLTAHLDQANEHAFTYSGLSLMDWNRTAKPAKGHTFYFPDDDPYGAQKLLQLTDHDNAESGTAVVDAAVLHPSYMTDCPAQPEKETRTWKAWLREMWRVRDAIPLTAGGILSPECLYVAENRPDMFIAFLLRYWKLDGGKISGNKALSAELLKLKVLCEKGSRIPLSSTYVRTPSLAYADNFLRPKEFFPWLKHDASLLSGPEFSPIGDLAQALRFGCPSSEIQFLLLVLFWIMANHPKAKDIPDIDRIYHLYTRIQNRYTESDNSNTHRETIRLYFTSRNVIYVPAYGHQPACWAMAESCVWNAPPDMEVKHPLQSRYRDIPKAKHLAEFFCSTVGIPDATIDDILAELCRLKSVHNAAFEEVHTLYIELDKRRGEMDSAVSDKLRNEFETHQLIFYETNGAISWLRPTHCLWSTVTDIKGMVALNDLYEDLPNFFIELLGVRTLTIQMVYDKLIQQAGDSPVEDVKETIWLLNSYIQDEQDVPNNKALLKSKVFPVAHPNGSVRLCSAAVDFAVTDRKHLFDWFSGKAKILDFDVDDTARLEPFIRWTGLDSRYLSSTVKEISALCGDSHRPLSSPGREIAPKAHGLLRIAVHFKSPRVKKGEQAFYDQLKNIIVRETDGISSEVHLNQDGKDIKVECSKSELHLQDAESGLTVYVPEDEGAQYLCFLDKVAPALLEWILTDPVTGICEQPAVRAQDAVSKVLQAESRYVALTLERAGIMNVDTVDDSSSSEPEPDIPNRPSTALDTPGLPQDDRQSTSWETGSRTVYEESVSDDVEEIITTFSRASLTPHGTSHRVFNSQTIPGPGRIGAEVESRDLDADYRTLLQNVVIVAQSTAFPAHDVSTVAAPEEYPWYLPTHPVARLSTLDKSQRDVLVGASGELFVFELLSRLNPALPGFSQANWQSTIRKYASIHEDYADLLPWSGRETADIRYTDTEGVFTSLLITKGYLSESWAGKTPEYYLEVKSTTSSVDTRFFMSDSQYHRMHTIGDTMSDSGNKSAVYVIFRVFNVGTGSTSLQVYVNPGLMEQRNELTFTAENWSVVPGPALYST